MIKHENKKKLIAPLINNETLNHLNKMSYQLLVDQIVLIHVESLM